MKLYSLLIKTIYIFLTLLLFGCSGTKKMPQSESFNYSIDKPIQGQLYTAERIRNLMLDKKYKEAINLFSKRRQVDINEIKDNEEIFSYWRSAWTLDDKAYDSYCDSIKNGKAIFVFEEGEWKIDKIN